jgi:hypothetical protein
MGRVAWKTGLLLPKRPGQHSRQIRHHHGDRAGLFCAAGRLRVAIRNVHVLPAAAGHFSCGSPVRSRLRVLRRRSGHRALHCSTTSARALVAALPISVALRIVFVLVGLTLATLSEALRKALEKALRANSFVTHEAKSSPSFRPLPPQKPAVLRREPSGRALRTWRGVRRSRRRTSAQSRYKNSALRSRG